MSHDLDGGGSSHVYGFLNRPTQQDRHIQNIIDHANDLFPDREFDLPGLASAAANQGSSDGYVNMLGGDDAYLDDFDRGLLGRPVTSHHSNTSTGVSPRVSLPHSRSSSSRRQHILDDASHHFRPFVPRSEDWRPPFSKIPTRLNQLNPSPATQPIKINQLSPSPATQPIFGRDCSQRMSGLQPGTQLVTPPFYTTQNNRTQNPRVSFQSSSPSDLGGSSPSTRLSLRKEQPHVANRPLASQVHSNTVRLALDHDPKLNPVVNGTELVNPRKALPDKCRAVFPYELFNMVQSKCFPHVYKSDKNVVISAPTGSGKTAILELAVCKLVNSPGAEKFKIVYQAPTKSLCSERARDWEKKFSHMNLKCVELTGDTSQAQTRRVGMASIIITTPEKWDSITRKWADHRKLLEMVRLVLIDEVHILKDVRGATLETVVSRMKTIGENIRFIALSATVPNIDDIATWLGRDHANQQEPAWSESFGEDLRPVKLKKYVYGYENAGNEYIFENSLDGKLLYLLGKHSEGKPIMVFCFTRKSCEHTAQKLAEWWLASKPEEKAWPPPAQRVSVINKDLAEIVRYGVAFHHAGLDAQDRSAIEQNFLSGQLHVICCTSTLAVGVNLPCHTVVLKGTVAYGDNGPQEYSDLEVMQMLGRAGRPQFDKSATAIIMTKRENAERYDKMISGEEVLESTLHLNLVEHLNSETGLGTIQSLATAKKWMSGTFLNVRMRKEPGHYDHGDARTGVGADERIQEWCERDIGMLQEYGLITESEVFSCTKYGKTMSRYMVKFETMKLILSIPRAPAMEQLLTALSKAAEFKDLRFKPFERSFCRMMNKEVAFPMKGNPTETWHKVFIMVQVHLGQITFPNDKESSSIKRHFATEKRIIFDRLNRLVRCVVDTKVYDRDAVGARNGLELARAIAADSWDSQPTQLLQISGIGPVAMRKLMACGVRSILSLAEMQFEDIERIMSRNPPFGKNLLKQLEGFPRLAMTAEISDPAYSETEDVITVTVKVNLRYTNSKSAPQWKSQTPVVTFMIETTEGYLAFFDRFNLKKVDQTNGRDLQLSVPLSQPDEKISCYFSCEEIVGTQVVEKLKPTIPASLILEFGNGETQGPQRKAFRKESHNDNDLDDEGLADEDMLDVINHHNSPSQARNQAALPVLSEEPDDHFPEIQDILENEPPAPSQMQNGKWMCNHNCRGGGLTKTGKSCTHKCCHEGLDKPRPVPKKKKRGSDDADSDHAVGSQPSLPHGTGPKRSRAVANHSVQRSVSASMSGIKQPRSVLSSKPSHRDNVGSIQSTTQSSLQTHSKRCNALVGPVSSGKRPIQRSTSQGDNLKSDLGGDIECIDLSALSEDDGGHFESFQATSPSSRAKGEQKLNDLHSKERGFEDFSRLTKPYKSQDSGLDKTLNQPFNPYNSGEEADEGADGSHYGSDIFEGDAELPDISSFAKPRLVPNDESSMILTNDETLYPGVVETLKERKDYCWEPNLSFTTVSELKKASHRFDLDSSKDSQSHDENAEYSSSAPPFDLPKIQRYTSPFASESLLSSNDVQGSYNVQMDVDETCQPLRLEPNPLLNADMPKAMKATALPNEPAWVAEFDSKLVEMFRGVVDFVDDPNVENGSLQFE